MTQSLYHERLAGLDQAERDAWLAIMEHFNPESHSFRQGFGMFFDAVNGRANTLNEPSLRLAEKLADADYELQNFIAGKLVGIIQKEREAIKKDVLAVHPEIQESHPPRELWVPELEEKHVSRLAILKTMYQPFTDRLIWRIREQVSLPASRQLSSDLADEAVNEALCSASLNAQGNPTIPGLLRKSIYNSLIRHHQRYAREEKIESPKNETAGNTLSRVEAGLLWEVIEKSLKHRPQGLAVLRLFVLEECTHPEIAQRLGMKRESDSRSALAKAFKALEASAEFMQQVRELAGEARFKAWREKKDPRSWEGRQFRPVPTILQR